MLFFDGSATTAENTHSSNQHLKLPEGFKGLLLIVCKIIMPLQTVTLVYAYAVFRRSALLKLENNEENEF